MRPSKVADTLQLFLKENYPILLTGAPGVGKTDLVNQACKSLGFDMLISHPVVSDSVDYKGLPAVITNRGKGRKEADFLPYNDLRIMIDADSPLIVFLDDLGQAPMAVQAACMQLLLARRIGQHKISEYVRFVAATNRRQDKAGVQGMLEPVKSRFFTIINVDPNVPDWVRWAFKNKMPGELVAYIRYKPNMLLEEEALSLREMTNTSSPRTLAHVGSLINAGLPKNVEKEVFGGTAGKVFADDFTQFLRVYRELPDIDTIIKNPEKAEIPTEPSILWATIGALVNRASKKTANSLITYAGRMETKFKDFSVMFMKDCAAKDDSFVQNDRFIEWISSNADVLIE